MKRFPAQTPKEFDIFKKLNTPAKIQDFIDKMPINFEEEGETSKSPLMTLRTKKVHCLEAAYLAAAILWYHGEKPLLMNLRTAPGDTHHAVVLFRQNGRWGAISKTNHAVLRYRDPVYRNLGELAMSYFNEYFKDSGQKTLRSYSKPFNLLQFGTEWLTAEKPLWNIAYALEDEPDYVKIFKDGEKKNLRRADAIEVEAGKLTEWKRPRKR